MALILCDIIVILHPVILFDFAIKVTRDQIRNRAHFILDEQKPTFISAHYTKHWRLPPCYLLMNDINPISKI